MKNKVSFRLIEGKESELQDMINRIIDVEIGYEMEINVDKTKVMRISRQTFPVHIMIDQKHLQNVEYLNYLCSMTTHDAKFTPEMKSRIALTKAAFNKKKTLFTNRVDLI